MLGGAAALILRRRHSQHQFNHDDKTQKMADRLQTTIQNSHEAGAPLEESVQAVGKAQEPLNDWNRRGWVGKALFAPPEIEGLPRETESANNDGSDENDESDESDGGLPVVYDETLTVADEAREVSEVIDNAFGSFKEDASEEQ